MGYCILRTAKLKSGQAMRRSLKHSFREQDTPNADPAKLDENSNIGAANVEEALAKFNARLPEKVRSNAVLAIEYLVSGSPEDIQGKTRSEQDAYFKDALTWLEAKHGKENVVYAGIHRDETTPHMYAYVVPLDERGKLNCRAFLGGAKALNQMQTDFAENVGQRHGLQRGIEGSKARHTTVREYYTRANEAFQPLPEVVTPPAKLRPEPEKPGLFAGKEAKQAWEADHMTWEREKQRAQIQHKQRQTETQAQTAAAVEVAQRNQAKAKEADALKAQVAELKKSNGELRKSATGQIKKAVELEVKLGKLYEVAQLFTPEEVKTRMAEKQRQNAQARQQAAEAAKREAIESEQRRRIEALPKLEKAHGAEYTYGRIAAKAIKDAGDAGRVDWRVVDRAVMREAIAEHGQAPEIVTKAILARSPALADPSRHELVVDSIKRAAPALQAEYEQASAAKKKDRGLSR